MLRFKRREPTYYALSALIFRTRQARISQFDQKVFLPFKNQFLNQSPSEPYRACDILSYETVIF